MCFYIKIQIYNLSICFVKDNKFHIGNLGICLSGDLSRLCFYIKIQKDNLSIGLSSCQGTYEIPLTCFYIKIQIDNLGIGLTPGTYPLCFYIKIQIDKMGIGLSGDLPLVLLHQNSNR